VSAVCPPCAGGPFQTRDLLVAAGPLIQANARVSALVVGTLPSIERQQTTAQALHCRPAMAWR